MTIIIIMIITTIIKKSSLTTHILFFSSNFTSQNLASIDSIMKNKKVLSKHLMIQAHVMSLKTVRNFKKSPSPLKRTVHNFEYFSGFTEKLENILFSTSGIKNTINSTLQGVNSLAKGFSVKD